MGAQAVLSYVLAFSVLATEQRAQWAIPINPGELFLFLVAIRHPGASRGRPRAQKNTPPPRTPPENNILAPQASRVYESTQNKFLECPAAPAAGRRTRAENEPPPPIALEERGAAAHSR